MAQLHGSCDTWSEAVSAGGFWTTSSHSPASEEPGQWVMFQVEFWESKGLCWPWYYSKAVRSSSQWGALWQWEWGGVSRLQSGPASGDLAEPTPAPGIFPSSSKIEAPQMSTISLGDPVSSGEADVKLNTDEGISQEDLTKDAKFYQDAAINYQNAYEGSACSTGRTSR